MENNNLVDTILMLPPMWSALSLINEHLGETVVPAIASHGYDIALRIAGDEGGITVTPSGRPEEPPPMYATIAGQNGKAFQGPALQAVAIAKDVFKALKILADQGESMAWLKALSIKATHDSPFGVLTLRFGVVTAIDVIQPDEEAPDPLATEEELLKISAMRFAYGALLGQELKKSGVPFSRFTNVKAKLLSHEADGRWMCAKL